MYQSTKSELKLATLNISGLKRRLIYPEISEFINQNDVVCLTETHTEVDDVIELPGFSSIAKHRKQAVLRKSGGIGVFVKNSISSYIENINSENEYALWLKIDKKLTNIEEDLILGVLYVPPEKSRFFNDEMFLNLEREIGNFSQKYKYMMLTGDMNARTAKLKDFIEPDFFLAELYNI